MNIWLLLHDQWSTEISGHCKLILPLVGYVDYQKGASGGHW